MSAAPASWADYLARYRAAEQQRDDDMRSGLTIQGYRYVGPPMIPTPERYIHESWRMHVDVFEQAMAARWAARFESWLRPRARPPWDLVTGIIRNDFTDGDAKTLARWLGIKMTS